MAYNEHQQSAAPIVARCAVVTLSDTRTAETDKSGRRIKDLLAAAGHAVVRYELIKDDPHVLSVLIDALCDDAGIDVILTNGGTGVSRRDHTVPVLRQKLVTELPGFGELFRMLSFHEIGSGAMLSRAVGGVARDGKLLFAMPGSTNAVDLAMSRLILPELKHLLHELRK